MMKKLLLVSSLLFLSISATAETNLRCEFKETLVREAPAGGNPNLHEGIAELTKPEEIIHISYQEGFFSWKLKSDSFKTDREMFRGRDISFGKTKIIYTDESNTIAKVKHEIHKQFLTYTKIVINRVLLAFSLNGVDEDKEEQEWSAKHEYLCIKLN